MTSLQLKPHRLLKRLSEFNTRISDEFDLGPPDAALESVGLLGIDGEYADSYQDTGYEIEPLNCRIFSTTGVDGVSFHLLAHHDVIDDNSPVVLCYPFSGNTCVGENLADFLALGCASGFDGMAYSLGSKLTDFCTPDDGEPGSIRHRVLAALREEFALIPWSDPEGKLSSLRTKYGGMIKPPTDEELDALL